MADAKRLAALMKRAKIVREARERKEITHAEMCDWLDDLRMPRGLWQMISFRLFGV